MKRLQKYSSLLVAIQAADPKTRVGILRSAPDEFIKTLLEVVLNFLAGNIPHPPQTFIKLKRFKNILRELKQRRRGSIKTIRRRMIQKGGFLPLLIAPILAAAAPTIGKAVAQKAAKSATETALNTIENRVKGYVDKL